MELTGKIIKVMEKRSGVSQRSGNNWASQDYVLEIQDGQYVRHMVFNVFGEDRIAQFNIQENKEYVVSFDIDAHEYNGRWFNDIRAWRVVEFSAQTPAQPQPMNNVPPVPNVPENDPVDDLPF